MADKQPISVLVLIYTLAGQVLLLERKDKPGYWQSVTGSREGEESLLETARRELGEETGLVVNPSQLSDWGITNHYEIYPHWRHRYPEGVTHNTEHVFGLALEECCDIRLAPNEHVAYQWQPWQQAAKQVFSPSNAEAISLLASRLSGTAV